MKNHRVLKLRSNDLSSLGGLDRVDFLFLALDSGLDMRGHVAGAVFPFQGRIRRCLAIHAGGIFRHSLASHAFLHDWQAVTFIVAAARGCHEYTVFPFPNSCTDHDTNFLNTFGFNLSKPEKSLCSNLDKTFPGCCFPMDSRFRGGKPDFFTTQKALMSIKDRCFIHNFHVKHLFYGKKIRTGV
jgi:hypothetical protein